MPSQDFAVESAEAVADWHQATIRPLLPQTERHTIHTYHHTSPESPDGRLVLFYASPTREGHNGSLRVVDRISGEETELAANLTTEDSHRAACQQWVSGGQRVVFHDYRDGEWVVVSLDLDSGEQTVIADHRLIGWAQPHADIVPMYGLHWEIDGFGDIEFLNLATGERHTMVTAAATREAFPQEVAAEFGDSMISLCFPYLSPDLTRLYFKLSKPLGGDFRSRSASHREQLVCYDLTTERFLFHDEKWGHPVWHPNARTILNIPNVLIDSNTGERRHLERLPTLSGAHPCVSPGGKLAVVDGPLDQLGNPGVWGIVVEDLDTQEYEVIHRFDDSRGATSWRRCHPHPVFSPDARRIYFNISTTPWTQLHVATADEQ